MSINLKTLISKLNDTSRQATTRAAGICVGFGHYEVELEHLLLALLEQPASDLTLIARHCAISTEQLDRDLRAEIGRLRSGNTRTPVFSRHVPVLLEQAWLIASLDMAQPQRIRSGHLLLALLTGPDLAQLATRSSRLFARFPVDQIRHQLARLTHGSQEAAGAHCSLAIAPASGFDAGARAPGAALDQYTSDLTQLARAGKLDPVIGRESEIRQTIDILLRRRQNNPILTGEAGVGKTAVVEGLALRIAAGAVPQVLLGVAIHTLDMGLLQAGASVKGEFESRLKGVIEEVKRSPHAIILFIDEAHTLIGAGGAAGQNDAANLLKPALARGELRTIAATTWSEYKQYFEKDAALARRFQMVKVDEPDEATACAMLRAMVPLMERHFKLTIDDDAVTEAVRLSHRYISGRQLPDKAVSVLDTACARVALGQSAAPAALEAAERGAERLATEMAALRREQNTGADHAGRLGELAQRHASLAAEQAALAQRWAREKALGDEIGRLRAGLRQPDSRAPAPDVMPGAPTPGPNRGSATGHDPGASPPRDALAEAAAGQQRASAQAALRALAAELTALQGETPMLPLQVDGHAVAAIVAGWTGIPLGKMVRDEIRTVLKLKDLLEQRILGQPHAIDAVAQRVRTARANLDDPHKPKGVFLFVGPSGTGKTATALALAELLYGGERRLITINMSQYQEAHSVSGLKGAPPGYVGYGQGGVLTEAVRRNPYSVVLLDEIEKAHADVSELFFQVFDKGVLEDAEGREIDFRNTIIIATSNLGSAAIMQACLNREAGTLPDPAALEQLLRPKLVQHFKPAFLGRVKVVPYYPISDPDLARIIGLKLERIGQRIRSNHRAQLVYDQALVEAVLARCNEVDSGARNVDHILNGTLLPEMAEAVLAHMADGVAIARIQVSASGPGQFRYTLQ